MKLVVARLCAELDCGEIYEGQQCPSCTSLAGVPLQSLVEHSWVEREKARLRRGALQPLTGIDREFLGEMGVGAYSDCD